MTKIRKIFKWAYRGKHWFSKQTRSSSSMSVLAFRTTHTMSVLAFRTTHTMGFFAKRRARLPKSDRFSHTLLLTITRLLFCLWTDPLWNWCYSLEKFNRRGWCVVLSTVHKVFRWPKFPQPSEWTNFPHATQCVSINEMMAKSFWRQYDINNLTPDYRKEKEESKETIALDVVTDSKNDKKWKEWLGICTQQENTGQASSNIVKYT